MSNTTSSHEVSRRPPFRCWGRFLVACLFLPTLAAAQPNTRDLVRLGDIGVTSADVGAYFERVPADMRDEAMASRDRVTKVVDHLFISRVLANRAKQIGLDKTPSNTLKWAQVQDGFLSQLYKDKYLAEIVLPAPRDMEVRARELYLATLETHKTPPRARVQHILVNLWGRTREMARERVDTVRAKALAGEDFLRLAAEFSDASLASKTPGDLGWVGADKLLPPLWKVVSESLSNGQVSDVIETKEGFHLVKRMDYQPPRQKTFEEVRRALIAKETDKIRGEAMAREIQAIRDNPETNWDPVAVGALIVPLPPVLPPGQSGAASRGARGGKPTSGGTGQPPLSSP